MKRKIIIICAVLALLITSFTYFSCKNKEVEKRCRQRTQDLDDSHKAGHELRRDQVVVDVIDHRSHEHEEELVDNYDYCQ